MIAFDLSDIERQLTRIADILESLTRDKVRNKPDTSPDAEGYWDIETLDKVCPCGLHMSHAGRCRPRGDFE